MSIMQKFIISLLFVIASLLLVGCKADYVDISSDSDFSHYIGKQYISKTDMNILGINLPPDYGETVDVYMVHKLYRVQHKSPEVITQDIFPKGSSFTINGVYECKNCVAFNKVRYVSINTDGFKKLSDVPITVSMHEIISGENITQVKVVR